jgi:high-affinity nickel permease
MMEFMFGLDEWMVRFGSSGMMALLVAALLGLRHATDPDHLTAVSTGRRCWGLPGD